MKRTSMISEEGRQPCTYRYRAWRRAAHSFLTSGATRDPWSPKALVLSTHESRMCFGTAAPVVGCGGRPQSVHARQNQDESRDHKSACATPTALVCGSCLNGFSVNPYTPVHFWAGVHAHSIHRSSVHQWHCTPGRTPSARDSRRLKSFFQIGDSTPDP